MAGFFLNSNEIIGLSRIGCQGGIQRALKVGRKEREEGTQRGRQGIFIFGFRLNSFEYFANIPLSNFHLILWELCVSSLRTLRLFLCVLCVSSFLYFASLPLRALRLFLCVLCVSSFVYFAIIPLCNFLLKFVN